MIARVAVGTETRGAFRVTVNDKILVHLLEFARYVDRPEVPRDITQQGISEIVGARRSHISLALSTLRERGLVEEKTVRVTDEVRRRKGYFLTPRGYESAKTLAGSFQSKKVRVEDAGGVKEVSISELPALLGEKYYLVDVLCCLNRDGTLDLAQLTGQKLEPPPERVEEKPTTPLAKAMAMCPVCRMNVEFPYEDESVLTVVCGSCGSAFKAAIGAPVYAPQAQPQMQATAPTIAPQQMKMSVGLATLVAAITISGASSFLLFTPLLLAACGMLLLVYPLLIVSVVSLKRSEDRVQVAFGSIFLFIAPFYLVTNNLGIFWIAFQFAGFFSLVASVASMTTKSMRPKFALGVAYSIGASLIPAMDPWGIPIGFGFLVGCGLLLAAVIASSEVKEDRHGDMVLVSILVAAFGTASFAHWMMFPSWDVQAVGRIALITFTLYAFTILARPLSRKARSDVALILGVFLIALGIFGAAVPSAMAWPPDLGIYFVIFGGGALLIATRMHKPDYVWSRICLGAGLFIVVMAVVLLYARWSSLETLWASALGLWMAVGMAIIASQFMEESKEKVISVRAGTIAAVGASVILAGIYLVMLGFGAEGAVELALGVPLVGYAFVKSGAPWMSRTLMSVLFMTTVAVTWYAVVAGAF